MKSLENSLTNQRRLDRLKICTTDDGTISLTSEDYKEAFHSKTGAQKEAIDKFLKPSELHRLKKKDKLYILDVCLGLGYNTGTLLDFLFTKNHEIEWWGLEIDKRPLTLALRNKSFRSLWSNEVIEVFQGLNKKGSWSNTLGSGKILWGDARNEITNIPRHAKFDLIFLDAFSPQKCPQLWTEEFLYKLSTRLATNGRLITYCTASAIRKSLMSFGLEILSIQPNNNYKSKWSLGTVGIFHKRNSYIKNSSDFIKQLSQKEEEHLLTRSAIPYRDPVGNATAKEILDKREEEQRQSNMESTSCWKKRWLAAGIDFFD